MTGGILFQAIVFLGGALICVPITKRFGLSAVLGYLLAGILIGPYVLGFVGSEGEDILHFAEFGVVMMLFLIGLEIEPRNFWNMRKNIVGMGGLQVLLTTVLGFYFFRWLGNSWQVSLAIGMAISLSSTAIILQSIKEKGLFHTTYGESSFSILLFQDIIVIFMLGALPLLSSDTVNHSTDGHGSSPNVLSNLPIGLQTLFIILSVVLIIGAGRYLIVPIMRQIANTNVRELLTGAALLIVLGISFLMELVGLSPALGAFLGGVVLATSEFKHELESTLAPFKDLLLGLFFMAVGASINFIVIQNEPFTVGGILLAVIAIKALVLFVVASIFKLKIDQRMLLTVGLAQVGEFAFVLLSFAFQLHILDQQTMDTMLVVTALSMTLTPILAIVNERFILPNIGTKQTDAHPMDHIAKTSKVILIGFGEFGSTVGRFLRAYGVEPTILDYDSNRVDILRKMGFEVYYGDATRIDLLESAGIADADILISAIDGEDSTLSLIQKVKKNYPKVKVLVRAKNRNHATELLQLGVNNIYRETLDTSVRLASDVLHDLGFRRYTIYRQAQKFMAMDEDSLRRLSNQSRQAEDYIFKVREEIAQQEKLLEEDLNRGYIELDELWDSEQRREFLEEE